LIWHDEVMSDLVSEKPAKVTIGSSSEATFVTPDIAGTPAFAIVTPGRRGYLLTLSEQMHGTICIGGEEHDVREFVRGADEPTGFRATPIGGNDWGVISLDASGDHKLFFQFVPLEEQDWNLGHPMILAAVGGFALSVAVLTGIWWGSGVSLGEAAFRAGSLSSLAIGFAAIVRWVLKQDNESRASLAFSVMLHAAILFATFQLYERAPAFEWPKPASVTGGYLVKADDIVAPKPEPVKPTVKPGAAAQQPKVEVIPPRHPWSRPKGKKVDKPTVQIATQVKSPEETGTSKIPSTRTQVPAVGIFVHEDILHAVIDDGGASKAIQKVKTIGPPGPGEESGPPDAGGPGTTVGGGDGKGPVGKQVGSGPIKIGKLRNAVCMGAGCGTGPGPSFLPPPKPPNPDQPTLTAKEIDDLIKSRQAMYRSCYQKQLNREPTLAGDVTLHFEIGGDGVVHNARRVDGSLTNTDVIQCVKNALGLLHFPQKGGAIVNYPFVFSSGQ
jgi:hypothetical protein